MRIQHHADKDCYILDQEFANKLIKANTSIYIRENGLTKGHISKLYKVTSRSNHVTYHGVDKEGRMREVLIRYNNKQKTEIIWGSICIGNVIEGKLHSLGTYLNAFTIEGIETVPVIPEEGDSEESNKEKNEENNMQIMKNENIKEYNEMKAAYGEFLNGNIKPLLDISSSENEYALMLFTDNDIVYSTEARESIIRSLYNMVGVTLLIDYLKSIYAKHGAIVNLITAHIQFPGELTDIKQAKIVNKKISVLVKGMAEATKVATLENNEIKGDSEESNNNENNKNNKGNKMKTTKVYANHNIDKEYFMVDGELLELLAKHNTEILIKAGKFSYRNVVTAPVMVTEPTGNRVAYGKDPYGELRIILSEDNTGGDSREFVFGSKYIDKNGDFQFSTKEHAEQIINATKEAQKRAKKVIDNVKAEAEEKIEEIEEKAKSSEKEEKSIFDNDFVKYGCYAAVAAVGLYGAYKLGQYIAGEETDIVILDDDTTSDFVSIADSVNW